MARVGRGGVSRVGVSAYRRIGHMGHMGHMGRMGRMGRRHAELRLGLPLKQKESPGNAGRHLRSHKTSATIWMRIISLLNNAADPGSAGNRKTQTRGN